MHCFLLLPSKFLFLFSQREMQRYTSDEETLKLLCAQLQRQIQNQQREIDGLRDEKRQFYHFLKSEGGKGLVRKYNVRLNACKGHTAVLPLAHFKVPCKRSGASSKRCCPTRIRSFLFSRPSSSCSSSLISTNARLPPLLRCFSSHEMKRKREKKSCRAKDAAFLVLMLVVVAVVVLAHDPRCAKAGR